MKKYTLIPLIVLVALFVGAGKYKISKVGQPDVYVPTLDSDAKTLTVENISGPGSVPIGGMVAVMPNIDAANSWQPPATGVIKDGFMRADGTTITPAHRNAGCKLAAGTVLPNMVGSFAKGAATSGTATAASKLVAAHIPQVSTNYTPAGTNRSSSISGGTGVDGYHGHDLHIGGTQYTRNHLGGNYYGGSDSGGDGYFDYSGSHSHGISGTAAAQIFDGALATITVGTAVGSQSTIPDPANVTVVWVIRVK